jgi:CRISPR-associated protein Csy1
LDSEILKFIDAKFKNTLKERGALYTLTAQDKKQLADNLLKEEFEPVKWIENIFKSAPSEPMIINDLMDIHFELMEFLSLDIGYRRNVRQALKDNFEYLFEHIKNIDIADIQRWESYISFVSVDDVMMFSFFNVDNEEQDGLSGIVTRIDAISEMTKSACVVSHSSKFSHPNAMYPKILSVSKSKKDGFIRTGNAGNQLDMHIGAAELQVFKLLELKINNKTLLDLFECEDLIAIADYFGVTVKKVGDWHEKFIVLFSNQDSRANSLVKQVYFLVADGYHQLSVLTPTPIVFDLKQRIDYINSFSNRTYTGKKAKSSSKQHEGFESLLGLTVQRHGGAHPKNISGLNNKYQNVYLLPSVPPSLKSEEVRLPTTYFFTNCLWPNQFKASFELLHKWLVDSRNNMQVRTRRDELLLDVFNEIVTKVWQIRATEEGWSLKERFDRLPKAQKVILDPHWVTERSDDEQYLNVFLKDMARWIILAYKKVLGTQALPLNDDELLHVHKLIDEQKEALL